MKGPTFLHLYFASAFAHGGTAKTVLAVFAALAVFASVPFKAHGDENESPHGIFVSGSYNLYSFSGQLFDKYPELADAIDTRPGFRAAVGYEYRRFSLAVESGFTRAVVGLSGLGLDGEAARALGRKPPELEVKFTPLVFWAGYNQPLIAGFGLEAGLGGGIVFENATYYKDVIGLLANDITNSSLRTPVSGARLFLTYKLPLNLRLHAGGGIDVLFERGGPIPMPFAQAGISFRPHFKAKPVPAPEPLPPAVVELPPEPIPVRAVYFLPEDATVGNDADPVLDEAARILRKDPDLHLTLRGYAADFGTDDGRLRISTDRAAEVMLLLEQRYGIEADGISLEVYGARQKPELADGTPESLRTVELVIEPAIRPAGKQIPVMAVYFRPEESTPGADSVPVLNEAARILREDSGLRLTLRGYAADFGTDDGRLRISTARAAEVMRVLVQRYGIETDRIDLEVYGARQKPELADGTPESLRSVELVIWN